MKIVMPGASAASKTLYGWTEGGKFYLSRRPPSEERRPANEYDTKDAAEAEAASRGCVVEWAE